jgi:hypothetical protein
MTKKEHPILFSGEMVRAILDGRKTQTRRTRGLEQMNQHPDLYDKTMVDPDGKLLMHHKDGSWVINWGKSPYGVPGDKLWVRETWGVHQLDGVVPGHKEYPNILYRADNSTRLVICDMVWKYVEDKFHWRPSIFMHRWASRILLEVVSIRVERVKDISNADAQAEGVGWWQPVGGEKDYRLEYSMLWDRINGKKNPWSSNPWVWVVEFREVRA